MRQTSSHKREKAVCHNVKITFLHKKVIFTFIFFWYIPKIHYLCARQNLKHVTRIKIKSHHGKRKENSCTYNKVHQ